MPRTMMLVLLGLSVVLALGVVLAVTGGSSSGKENGLGLAKWSAAGELGTQVRIVDVPNLLDPVQKGWFTADPVGAFPQNNLLSATGAVYVFNHSSKTDCSVKTWNEDERQARGTGWFALVDITAECDPVLDTVLRELQALGAAGVFLKSRDCLQGEAFAARNDYCDARQKVKVLKPRLTSGTGIAIPVLTLGRLASEVITDCLLGRNVTGLGIGKSDSCRIVQSSGVLNATTWWKPSISQPDSAELLVLTSSIEAANPLKQQAFEERILPHLSSKIRVSLMILDGKKFEQGSLGPLDCTDSQNAKKSYCTANCIKGGAYCHPEVSLSSTQVISGSAIIEENLRQVCILQKRTLGEFFKYSRLVQTSCGVRVDADCSMSCHRLAGIKYSSTDSCFKDALSDANETLLKSVALNYSALNKVDVWRTPSLAVRNFVVPYEFSVGNMFAAICQGNLASEAYCECFQREFAGRSWNATTSELASKCFPQQLSESSPRALFIGLAVTFAVFAALGVVMCARRRLRLNAKVRQRDSIDDAGRRSDSTAGDVAPDLTSIELNQI